MSTRPPELTPYDGQVVLVVNVASGCGFTPQVPQLEALYQRYQAEGFTVLGVPSADFGKQEMACDLERQKFYRETQSVSYPLLPLSTVKGKDAIPLFQWLREQGSFLSKPRWNFYKYLIDRDGELVAWFTSKTTPESPKLITAIEKCLATAKA